MARPAGRPIGTRETTIADLREEFLDRCRGKNLSVRTIEWYEDRTRRFSDWCFDQGILQAKDLTADDLEGFVLALQRGPYRPQTVRGFAQIVKTLARYGHRKGFIPSDLTRDFEMPLVPKMVIETFSDEQLEALLNQPDGRKWKGIRDRAILLTLLDTMARYQRSQVSTLRRSTSRVARSESWARVARSVTCPSARQPRARFSATRRRWMD